MRTMQPESFEEAMAIVDRLAEIAKEDLELVAKAIRLHSHHHGKDTVVDVEAAEHWIAREIDSYAFQH